MSSNFTFLISSLHQCILLKNCEGIIGEYPGRGPDHRPECRDTSGTSEALFARIFKSIINKDQGQNLLPVRPIESLANKRFMPKLCLCHDLKTILTISSLLSLNFGRKKKSSVAHAKWIAYVCVCVRPDAFFFVFSEKIKNGFFSVTVVHDCFRAPFTSYQLGSLSLLFPRTDRWSVTIIKLHINQVVSGNLKIDPADIIDKIISKDTLMDFRLVQWQRFTWPIKIYKG